MGTVSETGVKASPYSVAVLRNDELAALLRNKRRHLNLTQVEAAKDAGINYHTYTRAELGLMGMMVRGKVQRWLDKPPKKGRGR